MKRRYQTVLIALFISVFLPFVTNAQEVPLAVDCDANPSEVYDGETVTWDANASGGDENYTYEWKNAGNDVLSTDESFDATYSANPGDLTYDVELTVTVTDGSTNTADCYAQVTVIAPLTFGSCYANDTAQVIGNPVTWTVETTGGLGPNTYDWTGTDGLIGDEDTVEMVYTTTGEKVASLNSISSDDDQTITGPFDCGSIDIYTVPTELTATCAATPSSVDRDQTATWSADVSGGNEPYTVTWVGTDGLDGEGESINKAYSTTGTKTATIVVGSSDGQFVTGISCSPSLTVTGHSGGGSSNNNNKSNSTTTPDTGSNGTTTDDTTVETGDESNNDQTSQNNSNGQTGGNSELGVGNGTTTASTTNEGLGTTTEDNLETAPNSLQAAAILAFLGSHPLGTTVGGALLVILILLVIFLLKKKNNTV